MTVSESLSNIENIWAGNWQEATDDERARFMHSEFYYVAHMWRQVIFELALDERAALIMALDKSGVRIPKLKGKL